MKPTKQLLLTLLLNMAALCTFAQLQSSAFPAYTANITSYTVYLNSDSTQTDTETLVRVNIADTTQINKVHVKIKGAANNQLQQQQVAQLNQNEVYKRSAGINSPTSYDIYFKFPGNYANEKLEVELENQSGAKSAALTVVN